MMRRLIPLAMLLLAAAPLSSQTPVPASAPLVAPPSPAILHPVTVKVSLLTSEGAIVLELEKERAPITTANFLRYVDQKRLDGTSFYRAVKQPDAEQYGLVQGGVRYDPKCVLPPIPHEPTTKTGILHTDGVISMARNAPGTASGDFFINIGTMAYMDADPTQSGDNLGYAAFGHVVEGMDVVRKILAAPTSPTAGVGVMKGQMLSPIIEIITARRVKD